MVGHRSLRFHGNHAFGRSVWRAPLEAFGPGGCDRPMDHVPRVEGDGMNCLAFPTTFVQGTLRTRLSGFRMRFVGESYTRA